jgi:hypothetical protein
MMILHANVSTVLSITCLNLFPALYKIHIGREGEVKTGSFGNMDNNYNID